MRCGASVITPEIDVARRASCSRTAVLPMLRRAGYPRKKNGCSASSKGIPYLRPITKHKRRGSASRRDGAVPELIASDITTERRDTLLEEIKAFLKSVQIGERPLVSGQRGKTRAGTCAADHRCYRTGHERICSGPGLAVRPLSSKNNFARGIFRSCRYRW